MFMNEEEMRYRLSENNRLVQEITDNNRCLISLEISLEKYIEHLRIERAMYKAAVFHKWELNNTLQKYRDENVLSDGSYRQEFLTLEDMLRNDILSDDDYEFCRL